MQEAPDSASAHEAPTEDAVDNDDDLVKDAKKVYKPFASVHHYADCAIASVTWPLPMNFLVQTKSVHHTYSYCSILSSNFRSSCKWFSFGFICQCPDQQ